MKDPNGSWVGDYFGVIAFGVNRDVVQTAPQSWADLKKPAYKTENRAGALQRKVLGNPKWKSRITVPDMVLFGHLGPVGSWGGSYGAERRGGLP